MKIAERLVRRIPSRRRHCPLCGWSGPMFLRHGNTARSRPDARCPQCSSVERHRLAYRLLDGRLAGPYSTLHIAPEPQVRRWLGGMSGRYASLDLRPRQVDVAGSITDLPLPDNAVTLLYCSHVLEHVPDDRAALRELRRVVAPGGVAVLAVPVGGVETVEGSDETDDERLERFGNRGHLRLYGADFADRACAAGFDVEVLDAAALDGAVRGRESLCYPTTNLLFVCT